MDKHTQGDKMTLDDKNNILNGLVGGVKIYRMCSHQGAYEYEYMQLFGSQKTEHSITDMTIDQLIQAAWKLKSPTYHQVDTICIDLIGKTLYIDQTTPITVDRINGSANGVVIVDSTGTAHTTNNLWLKEE